MPLENLHMTVLEIAHSETADKIASLVDTVKGKIPEITDYTHEHQSKVVKPLVSFDASAMALSFLPSTKGPDENYSYHHLRRDIWDLCNQAGAKVASRYVVPSAHITIARFVTEQDFKRSSGEGLAPEKVKNLIDKIHDINSELRSSTLSWSIGEGKGLVCRRGTVWYGGGYSEHEGKGF